MSTLYTQQPCTPGYTTTETDKKKEALDLQGLQGGGDSWTRTNDPFDVNEVLYRLSHATLPFDVPTTLDYRLSHATMLSYFRPTSPVGYLVQFVLPTEPTDHAFSRTKVMLPCFLFSVKGFFVCFFICLLLAGSRGSFARFLCSSFSGFSGGQRNRQMI